MVQFYLQSIMSEPGAMYRAEVTSIHATCRCIPTCVKWSEHFSERSARDRFLKANDSAYMWLLLGHVCGDSPYRCGQLRELSCLPQRDRFNLSNYSLQRGECRVFSAVHLVVVELEVDQAQNVSVEHQAWSKSAGTGKPGIQPRFGVSIY